MSSTEPVNEFDLRHPHERWDQPAIPVVLDDEGRCVVCGLLVERDAWKARALAAEQEVERLRLALDACDHATYGWSLATAVSVVDKVRLIARAALALPTQDAGSEG